MKVITRNCTLTASSESGRSTYEIDTSIITCDELLVVNIDHDSKPFRESFSFAGKEVAEKDSIHFRVNESDKGIGITWSGVTPEKTSPTGRQRPGAQSSQGSTKKDTVQEPLNFKTSFPPISNAETEILILGSLPGDRSLQSGEYFAHPRNRFWKIIAAITNNPLPQSYSGKQELLLKSGVGVWNVLHKAHRKGSLDSAIQNEVPNALPDFIAAHKKLKVIGFDGRKPEALFDKYFTRRSDLNYISLPGCSPANARFSVEDLCDKWAQLLNPNINSRNRNTQ